MKVNSRDLIRVHPIQTYIVDKTVDPRRSTFLITHAEYNGDGWILSSEGVGVVTEWCIPDQDLLLTDDNLYILRDTIGDMVYLSFYKDSRRREEDAYSEHDVEGWIQAKTDELFITEYYVDTSGLTQAEWLFLLNVMLRGATPTLDGTDRAILGRFSMMGLLSGKGSYIGGGADLDSWTMKPQYLRYFVQPPSKFRSAPDKFNTQQLIGVSNIRFLGQPHMYYELYLSGKDELGSSFRVTIDNAYREGNAWMIAGVYGGFSIEWMIPDQDVTLSEDGVCLVKERDDGSFQLEFKYLAPAGPSIMTQVISGKKSWTDLEFPEAK